MFTRSMITCLLSILQIHACKAVNTDNGTFFWGVSIAPQAPILKFDSTLLVPPVSRQPAFSEKDSNLAGIWPGIQNVPELMQHVLANDAPQWEWFPFFCCQPAMNNLPLRHVYPGDTLTMQYRWNALTEVWFENWMVNPGAEGHAAGEVTLASALEIGPWKGLYAPDSDFNRPWVMLWVETQGNELWDWGTVYWSDVLVEAQTSSTEWCTGDWTVAYGRDSLHWTRSSPIATWNSEAGTTTCYIASIVYEGHG